MNLIALEIRTFKLLAWTKRTRLLLEQTDGWSSSRLKLSQSQKGLAPQNNSCHVFSPYLQHSTLWKTKILTYMLLLPPLVVQWSWQVSSYSVMPFSHVLSCYWDYAHVIHYREIYSSEEGMGPHWNLLLVKYSGFSLKRTLGDPDWNLVLSGISF